MECVLLAELSGMNVERLWDWYFVSFFFANGFTHHSPRGDLVLRPYHENIFVSSVILFFFVGHMMYFFGALLPVIIKNNRRTMIIVEHFEQIQAYLTSFKMDRRVRRQTINYFEQLWYFRYGIRKTPVLFYRLPIFLQTDILLDMFWDAFKHSILFKSENFNFKRALSTHMQSNFYMAGDFLYKPTRAKNRLLYIYSGVVQIFTTEDDESPILSFSSGTAFSEMSLLMQLPSVVFVKCATFCQILTLDIKPFYRVLKDFPGENQLLREEMNRRLQIGRRMQEIVQK